MIVGKWVSPWVVHRHNKLVARFVDVSVKFGDAADGGPEEQRLREFERLHPEVVEYDARDLERNAGWDKPRVKCSGVGLLVSAVNGSLDQRPYARVFSWRGVGLRVVVALLVLVGAMVGQVVWMVGVNRADAEALWLPMMVAGHGSGREYSRAGVWFLIMMIVLMLVVYFKTMASVLPWHRWHVPLVGVLVAGAGMIIGMVVGRAWMFEQWAASCDVVVSDGCWSDKVPSMVHPDTVVFLFKDDGVWHQLPYVVAGLLIIGVGVVLAVTVGRWPGWLLWSGVGLELCASVGLIGVMLSQHGAVVGAVVVGLVMALVWVPGEVFTMRFCVEEKLSVKYEWEAAFDLVFACSTAMFYIMSNQAMS